MHVPWAWIKQRPHFLAEALSQDFEVEVVYKHPLKVSKRNLISHIKPIFPVKGFWQLPFQKIPLLKYFSFLDVVNCWLAWLGTPRLSQFKYVWFTSVTLYPAISCLLSSKTKVIWDCMDDELEFESVRNNPALLEKYTRAEKDLMRRADFIFCSSEYLSQKIIARSGVEREITIVNNAIQLPVNKERECSPNFEMIRKLDNIFMYIGAVSAWFDWDCIINMLQQNPEANVVIVGPVDVEKVEHSRLYYVGSVARDNIFELMSYAKALIMPFKINELIRSVNPVKLYEYIFANRVVIAPAYSESQKFKDYVYLYDDKDMFSILARNVIEGKIQPKKSDQQNIEFVQNNQWCNRYQQIRSKIG